MNDWTMLWMAIIVIGLLSFLYRAFVYGGVRGAALNARIRRTVEEIDLPQKQLKKTRLRIYELESSGGPDGPVAGLEISRVGAGKQLLIVEPLRKSDVDRLVQALSQAAGSLGPPSS